MDISFSVQVAQALKPKVPTQSSRCWIPLLSFEAGVLSSESGRLGIEQIKSGSSERSFEINALNGHVGSLWGGG